MRRSSTTNHIGEAMGMPSRRSDVKMPVWLASTIAHASSEESRTLIGLPAAREEYLQEQRRAELAGPGKEHHRAREPDVERRDARHQAEPVTVLERVEQERERVGHDAVLAQEIEARAEAARPFVPDDDADRSEVERRELEAVALAESPDVCQPMLAPDGPRRV